MVSNLERSRVEEALPDAALYDINDLGFTELRESGLGFDEIWLELASRAAAAMGVREAVVDPELPILVADRLRADGLVLTPDAEAFAARRRSKLDWELDGIRAAQRAAEAGMAAAAELLRRAEIDGDWLVVDGEPLLAEQVREALRDACTEHGAPTPPDVIVASVHQGFGHEPGSGPLPAHLPIQIDLWPRDEASGCWADMTRTFVVGDAAPGSPSRRSWCARRSRPRGRRRRPGSPGASCTRSRATCSRPPATARSAPARRRSRRRAFSSRSATASASRSTSSRASARPGASRSSRATCSRSSRGSGRRAIGGVRFEDLLLVTDDGCETLTDYPYDLTP